MLRGAIPLLHISDAIAAEAFYCGKLGFRQTFAYRGNPALPNPCYMGLVRDGALIHVSSFAGDGLPGGGVVNLIVDDVDALHTEFANRGVAIHLPPTDQTWGNREMYILDADKNCLRFIQPMSSPT